MPIMKICTCGELHVASDRCVCKVKADRARNKKRRELMKDKKRLEKELIQREYNL